MLAAVGALGSGVPTILKVTEPQSPSHGSDAIGPVTRSDVIEALKQVSDPEIPVNIYDLGLV